MIDLSPELITVLMLGGVFVGLLTGYPLALVIGGVAMVVGFTIFGPNVANVIYSRSSELMISYIMLAVPLFVFMGNMLEYSGITERLYDALYVWLGGVRGGLALTTLLIGTILAATVGIIAASVTMLALVGFPSMAMPQSATTVSHPTPPTAVVGYLYLGIVTDRAILYQA